MASNAHGRLRFDVKGPSSGGVGKSEDAKATASIAKAAGLHVVLVDGDAGLGSLSASLGSEYRVRDFPIAEDRDYGPALLAMMIAEEADLVILDLGANAMLRGSASRTLRPALPWLRANGVETRVSINMHSGKSGLFEDAETFIDRFADDADVVLNIREGGDTSQFDALKSRVDFVDVIPVHMPGTLELIRERKVLPIDWVRNPQPGFQMAAAMHARDLLNRARQSSMKNWISSAAGEAALEFAARGAPRRWYTVRDTAWKVSDVALSADEAYLQSEDRLRALSELASDQEVLSAARTVLRARSERVAAYSHAQSTY